MNKINFATIGTSSITDKFLSAAGQCPEFFHYAVYSRNADTAKAFAARHHAPVFYNSLEMLAKDDNIDAVYIASPNALHYEQTMLLLNFGKHILCEKAIASNYRETKEMFKTARDKNLILMEAMRSLFDPGMQWIKDHLADLGTLRHATFSFCQYSSRYDAFKSGMPCNIFSPEMSAGALMDIGIYCIEPLIALFGMPQKITASSVLLKNNIDGCGMISAVYDAIAASGYGTSGSFKRRTLLAELIYSKISASDVPSQLQGENGTMYIDAIACPKHVRIHYNDPNATDKEYLRTGHDNTDNNMIYEIKTMLAAIQGKTNIESFQNITLTTMDVLDTARKQNGIIFPADKI